VIYTLIRVARKSARPGWVSIAAIYGLLALTLLPVAHEALGLLRTAKAHVILPVARSGRAGAQPGMETGRGKSWLSAGCRAFVQVAAHRPVTSESRALIVLRWLWMPVCLWAYSRLSGITILVPRYFSPALPRLILVSVVLIVPYIPPERWPVAAAAMGTWGLITTGNWSVMWPNHGGDNWRDAVRTEHRFARDADTPVIAVSPIIEAQQPVWTSGYPLPALVYAPLFVYPVRGTVYGFPTSVSDEAEQYSVKLVRETLAPHGRFVVLGNGRVSMRWVMWFARRTELAGWNYRRYRFDAVEDIIFERPRS